MYKSTLRDKMSDATFNNFFNRSRTFGLNVKVPERTMQLAKDTLTGTATGVFEPLFTYLETNNNVFTGDVAKEIEKCTSAGFNTGAILQQEDIKVNGSRPRFDSKF